MRSLQGQVAVVTGAGRGLGAAIAVELARAGAAVAILGRDLEALDRVAKSVTRIGRPVVAVRCDLADARETEVAIRDAAGALGPIDLLVNNAAVLAPLSKVQDLDSVEWRRTLDVNVGAALTTSVAVLPGMIERSHGWIVNVSSGAASGAGMPYGSAYSVSKAALEGLTHHQAAELRGSGVRINAVRPGRVDTDMQRLLRDESVVPHVLAAKHQKWQADGELLAPTVPARLVLALCCAEITGEVISVYDDEGRRLIAEVDSWLESGGPGPSV